MQRPTELPDIRPVTAVDWDGMRLPEGARGVRFVLWPALHFRVLARSRTLDEPNPLEVAVIALEHLGIRDADVIGRRLHIEPRLASLTRERLSSQGRLSQTALAQSNSSDALVLQGESEVHHVLQDAFTGSTWPVAPRVLVGAPIESTTAGTTMVWSRWRGHPPVMKVLEAAGSPPPLDLGRVREVLDLAPESTSIELLDLVPTQVLVPAVLYLDVSRSDGVASMDGISGKNGAVHRFLNDPRSTGAPILDLRRHFADLETREDVAPLIRHRDALAAQARLVISQRVGEMDSVPRAREHLQQMEVLLSASSNDNNASRAEQDRWQAMNSAGKCVENLLKVVLDTWPLAEEHRRLIAEHKRGSSQIGLAKLARKRARDEWGLSVPEKIGSVNDPKWFSVVDKEAGTSADVGTQRELTIACLLAAATHGQHPLRWAATTCPMLLADIDLVADLRNPGSHDTPRKISAEEANDVADATYRVAHAITNWVPRGGS
jgi:hypothetical protein